MSGTHRMPAPAPPRHDVAGGAWTLLFEDLLRGLVHTMNNRLTALSAFAELAAMDGELVEPNVLREEITRLHEASVLVATLSTRSDDMEALELRTVLEGALSIHAHHPRMRSASCSIEQSGLVLPVRVPRSALLRLLLLLIDAGRRAGIATGATAVCMRLSGDDAVVRAFVVSPEPATDDALRFAAACDATLSQVDGGLLLELPSLLALRRREGGA